MVVALIVAALIVLMVVLGGGNHGPGRHMGAGSAADFAIPVGATLGSID